MTDLNVCTSHPERLVARARINKRWFGFGLSTDSKIDALLTESVKVRSKSRNRLWFVGCYSGRSGVIIRCIETVTSFPPWKPPPYFECSFVVFSKCGQSVGSEPGSSAILLAISNVAGVDNRWSDSSSQI